MIKLEVTIAQWLDAVRAIVTTIAMYAPDNMQVMWRTEHGEQISAAQYAFSKVRGQQCKFKIA